MFDDILERCDHAVIDVATRWVYSILTAVSKLSEGGEPDQTASVVAARSASGPEEEEEPLTQKSELVTQVLALLGFNTTVLSNLGDPAKGKVPRFLMNLKPGR